VAKLWDFYDGEPFMENPHIAMIGNPFKVGSIIERKKSGFRKISQKKGKSTVAYKKGRKAAPRRKARRNPFPLAGIAINRPRRRKKARTYHMTKTRRGSYAYNPKHRKTHRRKARRNPAILGVTLPPVTMIAWGAGGFIAPPMIEGFVNRFLPAEVTSSVLGRYAVKIASVLGLTYLVKTVLSAKEAFPVALGGSLYVVVSAVNEFAPQLTMAPVAIAPVKAYRQGMISTGINAYRSGMIKGYSRPGLANPMPGLAQPSAMMPRWDITNYGMANPVFADPRFTTAVPR
jgi:hypothetical protein